VCFGDATRRDGFCEDEGQETPQVGRRLLLICGERVGYGKPSAPGWLPAHLGLGVPNASRLAHALLLPCALGPYCRCQEWAPVRFGHAPHQPGSRRYPLAMRGITALP
jgi:hypothetical protein